MSALSNYLIESSNPSEQSVESYHRSLTKHLDSNSKSLGELKIMADSKVYAVQAFSSRFLDTRIRIDYIRRYLHPILFYDEGMTIGSQVVGE
ncbi:unnamed protein product [Allacma fusca]|uniref:Uncharacterized protein n=1 Tax=Allacma fusca TaxID=39272 RepID=A0A8J2LF87_9HEXA|nr:unnamed protein product [Allacma fusca]